MLQWMGGSRRKVTTSRGSTQKRQKQYFEQRRRQQQQQTSSSDNLLEENVGSTSSNEKRSLDVLSLKTLSTVAKECNPRCLNGLDYAAVNAAENKPESNAPQRTIHALPGNPGKDPVEFASKEAKVCDPPCSNEMESSNANLDPWKNDISVLDILEDNDLKYNFRENPMSEDHVSFSVGGLGKVGTETPSPPHRMDPHGGLLCSKTSRGVELSKNPLGDIELDVDSVLQDIDVSLSGKSSKFSCYSAGHVETFEKEKRRMCFPVDDMGFDDFDGSFGGVVCGKRAYDINEDYQKNRYRAHPNFMVDDIFNDAQRNLPWEQGPRREYMSNDCWESRNLEENSCKRSHFFSESDAEIPVDGFNFTDTEFTTFLTPEKSINNAEVLPRNPSRKMNSGTVGVSRNPSQFYFPEEDPKDSSMSSEESCSSSAARRDIMDSVAKKSELYNKIWSSNGHGKRFPREESLHGHRIYAQQGKTGVAIKADTDIFDSSSPHSDIPSRLTADNKSKTEDGWFCTRENRKSDAYSDLTSFYKHSKTNSEAYEDEPWAEESTSAFADSKLADGPKSDGQKSRYSSPWNSGLASKSEVKCIGSFGVIESPETRKLPPFTSGYARKDREMQIDCNLRKHKFDFFAMGIIQIGDKEGCSLKTDWENLKVPSAIRSPEFPGAIKSSAVITSDKLMITGDENENSRKEQDPDKCVNRCKETETAVAGYKGQRDSALKNVASTPDRVLMHQSYFFQFMAVQQTSVGKTKEM